jgi:hypothetical protein
MRKKYVPETFYEYSVYEIMGGGGGGIWWSQTCYR